MTFHKDLPIYSFTDKDEFYFWLSQNFENTKGFWLRYFKKGSKIPTILPTEAVDVVLCWGWIDGLLNRYDDISYLVRFTQRRKKSVWSKINVEKVGRLILSGEMQPSGLVHVESAKMDGRWDNAYSSSKKAKI